MTNPDILAGTAIVLLFVVFGGTILGIYKTKTPGFGKYTTSAIVLTLVLFVAALAFVLGQIDGTPLVNLLFAVAGYAGGLVTVKADES